MLASGAFQCPVRGDARLPEAPWVTRDSNTSGCCSALEHGTEVMVRCLIASSRLTQAHSTHSACSCGQQQAAGRNRHYDRFFFFVRSSEKVTGARNSCLASTCGRTGKRRPRGYHPQARRRVVRQLGDPGWKPAVRVGEAAIREVAAYLLDHDRWARVPTSVLVRARHPVFCYQASGSGDSEQAAAAGSVLPMKLNSLPAAPSVLVDRGGEPCTCTVTPKYCVIKRV